MGFKDESGEIVGFDIDLAKAVGEKLGKKIEFQSIDWSMKEADLKGKAVAAQTGSTAVTAMEKEPEVVEGFKDGKPVTYESNNDVLMDLEAGRVDAAVADEIIVRYYISKKGEDKFQDGTYASKEKIKEIRKNIGLVFQGFNLFPHKSVLENLIEAPIRVLGQKPEEAKEKAKEILNFLELGEKADCYPYELSGGQKQRVAIGRALAMKPKLMCFDEPTSALDPALTGEVAKLIKSLSGEGMAMLIITHDMEFDKMVVDRIVSMENGKILEEHIYANQT